MLSIHCHIRSIIIVVPILAVLVAIAIVEIISCTVIKIVSVIVSASGVRCMLRLVRASIT